MTLTVKNLMDIIEQYAPLTLKEDFDNVGLMVGDTENIVNNILVCLDCTVEVIKEAKEKKCNFILSHHPLFFIKPKSITSETIKGEKVISLIKNDIALYAAHTNLDSTKGGLNDFAVELLGFKEFEVIDKKENTDMGIGRIIKVNGQFTLKEICKKVKKAYDIEQLRFSGDLNKKIKKIALINGSGTDYFSLATNLGCDCIITGDTTYHYVSDLYEQNVALIDAGHFNSEWPAMKVVSKILEKKIEKMGLDNQVILAETSKDVYNYF